MVTSKKTPARKVAKRASTVKAEAGSRVVAKRVVDAAPDVTPVPREKQKLIRDSFTMPKGEYEQIAALKARLLGLAHAIKKGELLRAGIKALTSMRDTELLAAVAKIQRLKTGRPEKSSEVAKVPAKKKN